MDKPNQLFKAFSDETRLRILNLLAQRDHCVCEFQAILRVPQPRISRHLAYLRRSGLVTVSKCGKWATYGLAKPRNNVHAALLRCVGGCFSNIDFLQRDIARGRKLKRVRCQ
ncbi:MAG: metalloregulator ArsR/SmtB family transcription factor [Verrucomicrobiia bacterium]|jgi:ArsR family transcriptional regulator